MTVNAGNAARAIAMGATAVVIVVPRMSAAKITR